uniref:Endothelial cell adhesion molecule b n=1 Tax=Neogobius melanostomus TaxID=47308 RepID=A0A8C6STH8_9GOBI
MKIVFNCVSGDTHGVEIPSRTIEAVKGQKVTLQAWYSPSSDISKNVVLWTFANNQTTSLIHYSSGEVGYGKNVFTKRVGFSTEMPSANLSIYINNTQESDSGRYVCSVIVPEDVLIGELTLNVKVPPSPPVCTMTGNPVVKGNVTLGCTSSQGKPAPQYKWTKAAPLSEVFFSPMQNERQGTLHLTNLTKSVSGKYVCRASNTAGSETCSINLEVVTSSNARMIAAATLGSILGLLAMVLFLIFLLRRREDPEEEMANEIKEDAQAPKRVSWAKSTTGSDIMSKNGTLSSIATSPRPRDPPNFHYPYSPTPASDSCSVIHAYQLRPGEANTLQGLPGYNMGGTAPRKPKAHPTANGAPPYMRSPGNGAPGRPNGAQPQVPPPVAVSPQVSSSTLTRMGAVAVMVPAQSQAGSLV